MGITTADYVLDGSVARIAEGNAMHLCATEPTTYTQATDDNSLGSVAMTPGDGNGDYTFGDGDTSGRKVTIAAQAIPVSDGGDADHVAIVDTGNDRLLHVTTTTERTVADGDTYNTAAFDWENEDAA